LARGSAPEANNLSLRLTGSLHALLLSAKAREPAPIYPSGAIADADMPTLLQAVLQRHDPELTALIENAPQTNELRRTDAVVAAAHWLKVYKGCDLITSELGVNASLNLVFDKFHLALGDGCGPQNGTVHRTQNGKDRCMATPYRLRNTQGCYLAPLDLRQPRGLLRLRS